MKFSGNFLKFNIFKKKNLTHTFSFSFLSLFSFLKILDFGKVSLNLTDEKNNNCFFQMNSHDKEQMCHTQSFKSVA